MKCACCGEEKPTVALRSRNDVELCRDCLEWLLRKIGVSSTPTLPVADMAEAATFYQRAAFEVRVYTNPDGSDGGGGVVGFAGPRGCGPCAVAHLGTGPQRAR